MDNFAIIDIKTGFEMSPYVAIQEAAYELMYEETLMRKEPIELTFDEDEHIYKLNYMIIPSVTQILRASLIADFSDIPFERLKTARDFGSAVHKACELYDKGTLDERTLDPNLWPYLDGWFAYEKDIGADFITIEQPIASKTYRVAGTPDRISKSDKRHRFAVLLNNEGTYKITEYKDKTDRQVFLAALSVFNWKERNK